MPNSILFVFPIIICKSVQIISCNWFQSLGIVLILLLRTIIDVCNKNSRMFLQIK